MNVFSAAPRPKKAAALKRLKRRGPRWLSGKARSVFVCKCLHSRKDPRGTAGTQKDGDLIWREMGSENRVDGDR